MEVEPFAVHVPEATLTDLRERLARTRWPGDVFGEGWSGGADLAYLRELLAWWREGFDWRAQEAALNEWPHFRATVDGRTLHFVHARGDGPARSRPRVAEHVLRVPEDRAAPHAPRLPRR